MSSLIQEAAELIRSRTCDNHTIALVLGSGWAPAADLIGQASVELPFDSVPGFTATRAQGHPGRIRSIEIDPQHRLLLFLGRVHLYEGLGTAAVAHSIRVAAALGCRSVILTNAAGSLNPRWPPGSAVLIADHINLTGMSPITGPNFVDLTDLYSKRLRERCLTIDPSLPEGIYAGLPGPHYETPAEIQYLARIGAQLVGMSTVLEAIAAREAGMEVLGISLVTNLAAGISPTKLVHQEVLATGRNAAERLGRLLKNVVRVI